MKTAATVLQELMVKLGETPEYKCVAQDGLQHLATFEYCCKVRGTTVTAVARSKKEAKQDAARLMLLELAAQGMAVPPPYATAGPVPPPYASAVAGAPPAPSVASSSANTRSYKALLKELCEEYRLPGVEYQVVGDVGPAHLRHFTVEARVGEQRRRSTATTKKLAHQRAAEQLYHYFRENLSRLTNDFVEEEALVRAHEKAMERYVETRTAVRRPDLSLKVRDYHRGLLQHLDEEQTQMAREMLEPHPDAVDQLKDLVDKLGLELEFSELDSTAGKVMVVGVEGFSPSLAMAGPSRQVAAARALDYMQLALHAGDY